MTSDRRRFVIRLALSVVAMLVFCGGVFFGLGWAVTRRSDATARVFGADRFNRLYTWYLRTADGLDPWDSDGDGFSNGLEMFFGSDPWNPKDYPDTNVHVGVRAYYTAYCDEWMPARGTLLVDTLELRIVPGTPFQITGNHPAMMFRKDANDAAAPDVAVVAAKDGRLYFQYKFDAPSTDRDRTFDDPLAIKVINLRTGKMTSTFVFPAYGWRGPQLVAKFCDEHGEPLAEPSDGAGNVRSLKAYVARPADWEKAKYFFLGHRLKAPGANWQGAVTLNPAFGPAYRIHPEWLETNTFPADYEWQISTALKAPP
jgi:hypothetical protein